MVTASRGLRWNGVPVVMVEDRPKEATEELDTADVRMLNCLVE